MRQTYNHKAIAVKSFHRLKTIEDVGCLRYDKQEACEVQLPCVASPAKTSASNVRKGYTYEIVVNLSDFTSGVTNHVTSSFFFLPPRSESSLLAAVNFCLSRV